MEPVDISIIDGFKAGTRHFSGDIITLLDASAVEHHLSAQVASVVMSWAFFDELTVKQPSTNKAWQGPSFFSRNRKVYSFFDSK